jgi:hypothetical protein
MILGGYLLGIMGKTQKSTLGFTKIESLQERNLPFSKSLFLSCARRSLDTLEKSEEVIPFLESPADQPVRKLSDYFFATYILERERESRPDMQTLFIRGQLVCTSKGPISLDEVVPMLPPITPLLGVLLLTTFGYNILYTNPCV